MGSSTGNELPDTDVWRLLVYTVSRRVLSLAGLLDSVPLGIGL